MIFTRHRKTVEKNQAKISVREAHVLWRYLSDIYTIIEQINVAENFGHDKDFQLYLNKLSADYEKEAKQIELTLDELSIFGPTPNSEYQRTTGNTEIHRDKDSADLIFALMRLDINLLLQTFKDPVFNDNIRSLFTSHAKRTLKRFDAFVKYMKAKNWMEIPPLYPYVQQNVKEQIGATDIYLLWEHLVFRYKNIRQTRILSSYTANVDLKLLLDAGIKILEKQKNDIESKLQYYGVTLPKPYTNIVPTPETTELIEDRYIFNTILTGMQNALALHGSAIQDIIVNDAIRNYFINLTFDEIDMVDKMNKFGRLRGWTFTPPSYMFGK